jgi:hypothetical protein
MRNLILAALRVWELKNGIRDSDFVSFNRCTLYRSEEIDACEEVKTQS